MALIQREVKDIWYCAYGSNMLSSVLCDRRKVSTKRVAPVKIHDYVLTFSLLGVPYNEPAMANIEPSSRASEKSKPTIAHGVAFLISPVDFARIIASEGGGITYRPVKLKVTALDQSNENFHVHTLLAKSPAPVPRLPSKRYMSLLIEGAKSHNLPLEYQQMLASQKTFNNGHSRRYSLGKWLFDAFWMKIAQRQIQRGVMKLRNSDGTVPRWFMLVFDLAYNAMWAYHDYFHSHIWGRGDGL